MTSKVIATAKNPVESGQDATGKLKTLLRLVVQAAAQQLGLSKADIAEHVGMSAPSFSKLINPKGSVEPDRIVAVLEKLGASDATIRSAVLLAYASNASGKTCAKYFLETANWVFSPDNLLAESREPRNLLVNMISDAGLDPPLDHLTCSQLAAFFGNQPVIDVGQAARAMTDLLADEEIPGNLSQAVRSMDLQAVKDGYDRYSGVLAVDFQACEEGAGETGWGTQRLAKTNSFDFLEAKIRPNRTFWHEPHPGIHMMVVRSGSCVLGRWRKEEGGAGKKRALAAGVALSSSGRSVVVYDGSLTRHGVQAGDAGTEFVVLLLKPSLGVASITQLHQRV